MKELFLRCPGCNEGLDPEDEFCVGCRRPREPGEIAAGRAEADRRARAAGWRLAGKRLAMLAVAGAALYAGRGLLAEGVDRLTSDFHGRMNAVSRGTGKPMSPETMKIVGALATAKHVDIVVRGDAPPESAPDAPAQSGPSPAPPAPAPFDPNMGRSDPSAAPRSKATAAVAPAEGSRRVVYGVVYDLKTAEALPNALLLFAAPYANPQEVQTDEQGHYAMTLPNGIVGGTLTVTVKAPGYEGQTEDADPPYYERPESERRAALEQLAPSDLEPQPLRFRESDMVVRLDLVVAPKKSKASP